MDLICSHLRLQAAGHVCHTCHNGTTSTASAAPETSFPVASSVSSRERSRPLAPGLRMIQSERLSGAVGTSQRQNGLFSHQIQYARKGTRGKTCWLNDAEISELHTVAIVEDQKVGRRNPRHFRLVRHMVVRMQLCSTRQPPPVTRHDKKTFRRLLLLVLLFWPENVDQICCILLEIWPLGVTWPDISPLITLLSVWKVQQSMNNVSRKLKKRPTEAFFSLCK